MKQNHEETSTQPQIFESPHQQAFLTLIRPNPPTPEAIKRAQFKDKTYHWTGKLNLIFDIETDGLP